MYSFYRLINLLAKLDKKLDELKEPPHKRQKTVNNSDNPIASTSQNNQEEILEENPNENQYVEEDSEDLKFFEDELFTDEVSLTPKIFFNPSETPNIYSESAHIFAPITKNSSFTYGIANDIISIIKGNQKNSPSPQKIDLKSRDSEFNKLLSHVNSKFPVSDVPEGCFRIASSAKPALATAYRTLSRQQMILKNLIIHAQINLELFKNGDKQEVEELIRIYIHPIEAQTENVHEIIRKIRSIALPNFLNPSIKRSIITAEILPSKIWNLTPAMQSQIQAARTDFIKRTYSRNTPVQRESRPFQTRGRFQDRRGRPQFRRGGNFKRRYETPKSDNKRQSEKN